MNAGSSLTKWAPYDLMQKWRTVDNSQGLLFLARNFQSEQPEVIKKLRVRVSLSASDSAVAFTNHIKAFFKALRTYPHLEELDMSRCNLSDEIIVDHMQPMLEVNKSLRVLDLIKNAFGTRGASAIFSGIASHGKIHTLNISFNKFGPEVAVGLNALLKRDCLTKLEIGHNEQFGAQGLKDILGSLKETKNLKTLAIENTKLDQEGGMLVADLLKSACHIQGLNVSQNNFGCEEIAEIVANFENGPEKNKTLRDLNISKNPFTDRGFDAVVSMMTQNTTLTALKMNKCGITTPKFIDFCEKMLLRYQQPFGPHPQIENLAVGANGLGNNIGALTDMLRHKNCRIHTLNYEGNELTDFGAKKWKEFLTGWDCNRVAEQDNYEYAKCNEKLVAHAKSKLKEIQSKRNNFHKLSLMKNAITADGAEHLAAIVTKNKIFNELDLRLNKIGLKGAIFFKKAFRARQCDIKWYGRTFTFHILPDDITIAGVNHLAISVREKPEMLLKYIKSKGQQPYNRPERLAQEKASALEKGVDAKTKQEEKAAGVKPLKIRDMNTSRGNRVAGGGYNTKFAMFDTPPAPKSQKDKQDTSQYKEGIVIVGQNEEKEDAFKILMLCTYKSFGLLESDRGELYWNKLVHVFTKLGWGSCVANTLYRYGLLMRLQYASQSQEYIEDLHRERYRSTYDNLNNMSKQAIVEELVADDIKLFWEQLMPQTSAVSGGLTMFEAVLKYGKSPLLDPVRQFLNVFPAHAYTKAHNSKQRRKDKNIGIGTVRTKSPVFLEQMIAASGLTYRDLCLQSKDKFVKRYAEAKDLVLFRFLIVDSIYKSRYIRVSKVEDLLLTEEYDDSERFFYMRQIARTSPQEDQKLAQNDFDAHNSFMESPTSYIDDSKSFIKVENMILKRVNATLDINYWAQISQLHHREQALTDDKLVPTFSTMYKTDLKTVLDNQSIAGGRDLEKSRIILKMLCESLSKFNDRKWIKNIVDADIVNKRELLKEPRIHGNVKPRNIVLRVGDELPDLDNGVELMPGKWVLTDMTRSTKHKDIYIPDPNSAYNPPEVAKRTLSSDATLKYKIEADEKMDVWQFGCVLYEMLSGTSLFRMEARDDSILLDEDRGELANWLCLDEERVDLVLSQLRVFGGDQGYNKGEIEKIIECGKSLVQWCLQGRPGDRPSFNEILNHPFMAEVNRGEYSAEKDVANITKALSSKLKWLPSSESSFYHEEYKASQPHVHLINTEFEQAGSVIRSLKQTLSTFGCRLTTDSDPDASDDKVLYNNVKAARVICCLLTSETFYKPSVMKQLLIAEDFRLKDERAQARVCFLLLGGHLNLSKHNLTFNKKDIREKWTQSDSFQYLVKSLAEEDRAGNLKLSALGIGGLNKMFDDLFDSWNIFLNEKVHPMILSYIQDPIKYQPESFLLPSMLDKMLIGGKLVRLGKLTPYEAGSMGGKNYLDGGGDLQAKKMEEHKDKFMGLYFLPAKREKKGAARVFVLSGPSIYEEIANGVAEVASALESPSTWNKLSEEEHKDPLDYRNKVFSKVKTSYNLKKETEKYMKTGGRYTKAQKVKDRVLNVERSDGELVVVLFCTPGIFKRYSFFLKNAVEKREDGEFVLLLLSGPGFKPGSAAVNKEIDDFCPVKLKAQLKNKDNYLPYFKAKKDIWQFEATMTEVVRQASYKMEHPVPKEHFIKPTA
eukprot:snap_masked-scaffold_78-processed-gene-0.47-mRNA-1 protein AED:1.00 eAED:1.00 QI:0/-1/0/0/-1/1/1/0/1680